MPLPLTPSTRLQRTSALWTQAGTEVVVVSGNGEVFLALDDVGSQIWQVLESPVEVRELVTDLRKRYAVDEERCLTDVLAYLDTLLAHRVVSVVS